MKPLGIPQYKRRFLLEIKQKAAFLLQNTERTIMKSCLIIARKRRFVRRKVVIVESFFRESFCLLVLRQVLFKNLLRLITLFFHLIYKTQ
jgi:hypothetical protein